MTGNINNIFINIFFKKRRKNMPIACFCIVDPKDELRFIDNYIKSSD